MEPKTILITGATSGIGEATARLFAQKGHRLIITGRRKERLAKLQAEFEALSGMNCLALNFDVSSKAQVEAALNDHSSEFQKVSVLINNAGLAKGVEPMQAASIEDWDEMIDTNLKGLLYMTRLMLPYLLKHKTADIVNLGSVAGRWVYPGGGVYCATKFAVRALSEGLRLDLIGTNIRVTNIEPGRAETEFSIVRLGNEEKAKKVYEGMTPLSSHDIAESIAWCIERPSHVTISEMVIFPTDQAGITSIHKK